MKKHLNLWLGAAILLFCVSCAQNKENQLLKFDLAASYPEREFPYEEIFETRYLPVQSDSIVVGNLRIVYGGKDLIIGTDRRSGDIVFMDGAGKITEVLNKKGNSGEEYMGISGAFYDARTGEIYVLDVMGKKILVIDRGGNTLRRFDVEKGHGLSVMMDFNEEGFITYNSNLGMSEDLYGSYTVLSKKDGKVLKDFKMPCQGEKRYASVIALPNYISIWTSVNMLPGDDYVMVSEAYCDTVYRIGRKNYDIKPYLVKEPAFHTLDRNKKMFLEPCLDTPRYLVCVKVTAVSGEKHAEFEAEEYFYDKTEGKFYKSSNLYTGLRKAGPFYTANYNDYGKLAVTLDPGMIMDMREKEETDPRLKAVSEGIGEDDNPVIKKMVLKKR